MVSSPFKSRLRRISALSILVLLAILTFRLHLAVLLHVYRPLLAALDSSGEPASRANLESPKPTCFVYDRPPRTGSTTIGRAIANCLFEKGYKQPKCESKDARRFQIARMLELNSSRIGVLSQHICMTLEDVKRMKNGCAKLFYVSSTRPVRERMWSGAKYTMVSGARDADLSTREHEKAIQRYMNHHGAEFFLEAYPYLGINQSVLEVKEGDRLVPDYVIRSDRLDEDLGGLLIALGCEKQFKTINVHRSKEDAAFLMERKLVLGDTRYKTLSALAERVNERALKRVAEFVE